MMIRAVVTAVVFAACALPLLSHAACTSPKELLEADDATNEQIESWLALLPDCQNDGPFLAALGHVLNRQGRYLEASDHLERALMLDPGLKGAQVDYAIALAGTGDLLSANALLGLLLEDPELPSHLRPQLQRELVAFRREEGWQRRLTLSGRIGHDSNLRGAPNLTALSLTLEGQTVDLPLDESYRAVAGHYIRADAQLDLRRDTPDGGRWDAVIGLRMRHNPTLPDTGSRVGEVAVERSTFQHGPATSGYYLGLAGSSVQLQSGSRQAVVGLSAGWGLRNRLVDGCQARLGAEIQQRQYLSNEVLSGRYAGVSTLWSCDNQAGRQWLISMRAGQDSAREAQRPGGDQGQWSLRMASVLPVRPSWLAAWPATQGQLLLDVEYARFKDSTGYSELLESGRLRRIERTNVKIEYQLPIRNASQWVLGLEAVDQKASLALFRLRSNGPYLLYRQSW